MTKPMISPRDQDQCMDINITKVDGNGHDLSNRKDTATVAVLQTSPFEQKSAG